MVEVSAREEYKRACAIVRGTHYWDISRSEVADAADAVISGLEAELAEMKQRHTDLIATVEYAAGMKTEAEAELAEPLYLWAMLRLAVNDVHRLRDGFKFGPRPQTNGEYLANLRVRAREGTP